MGFAADPYCGFSSSLPARWRHASKVGTLASSKLFLLRRMTSWWRMCERMRRLESAFSILLSTSTGYGVMAIVGETSANTTLHQVPRGSQLGANQLIRPSTIQRQTHQRRRSVLGGNQRSHHSISAIIERALRENKHSSNFDGVIKNRGNGGGVISDLTFDAWTLLCFI